LTKLQIVHRWELFLRHSVDLRRYSRHLVRSIWRHNSVADLFRTKFSTAVQNHISMTVKRSKSKPGVKFKYGGRLFLSNGK